MGMSNLRQKLNSFEPDPGKKEDVLRELKYFNSIAPRSLREKFHINKDKTAQFCNDHPVGFVVGLLLLFPLILMLFCVGIQFAVIGILIWVMFGRKRGTPEYQSYNFGQRIVQPVLSLFDDDLQLSYHYNHSDLVDEDLNYDMALVEEHLVKPMNKRYRTYTHSFCSYDWNNTYNTDAFESLVYKLYYEYEDSDGDKREEVYFDGVILKFRTSFTVNGTVNIMSTTTKKNIFGIEKEKNRFKKIKDKDVVVIDTENHEFAENFDTIATYETEAYRYLTPTMIETLLKLRKEHYICICIKGNVMTVTINGYYKDISKSVFSTQKPFSRCLDSQAQLDNLIGNYRKAMLSIYELKDLLDPCN